MGVGRGGRKVERSQCGWKTFGALFGVAYLGFALDESVIEGEWGVEGKLRLPVDRI